MSPVHTTMIAAAIALLLLGQTGHAQPDWVQAAGKALSTKFCSNTAFTNKYDPQQCRLVDDRGVQSYGLSQSMYINTVYFPLPMGEQLPKELGSGGGTQRGIRLVEPACSGRAVARAVFKMTKQPVKVSRSAGIRFTPTPGPAEYGASPVVRCYLDVDKATATAAQALAAAEKRCFVCAPNTDDANGCPSEEGAWFSDSFTLTVEGCTHEGGKAVPYPEFVEMVFTPGWRALVAKVEVCKAFGCFDSEYEAQKVKQAKPCTVKDC